MLSAGTEAWSPGGKGGVIPDRRGVNRAEEDFDTGRASNASMARGVVAFIHFETEAVFH